MVILFKIKPGIKQAFWQNKTPILNHTNYNLIKEAL